MEVSESWSRGTCTFIGFSITNHPASLGIPHYPIKSPASMKNQWWNPYPTSCEYWNINFYQFMSISIVYSRILQSSPTSHLSQVEVDEMLRLMRHVRSEVTPHHRVPSGVVLFVELLLVVFFDRWLWLKCHPYIYIYSWLVVSTPLKNMKVSWDHYSQYMEKWSMFQTTNQIVIKKTWPWES